MQQGRSGSQTAWQLHRARLPKGTDGSRLPVHVNRQWMCSEGASARLPLDAVQRGGGERKEGAREAGQDEDEPPAEGVPAEGRRGFPKWGSEVRVDALRGQVARHGRRPLAAPALKPFPSTPQAHL